MTKLPRPQTVQFPDAFQLKIYDEIDLLVMEHPNRTQDDPGFAALYDWFAAHEAPWRFNTLFNMLPWPGITPFYVVEDFAHRWYELVGDKDTGRRVASVDNNPLTTSRYATESFQNIFPTRHFKLFDDYDNAIAWITDGYDLSPYSSL